METNFIKKHLGVIISIICIIGAFTLILFNIEASNKNKYLENITYSQLEEKINNQETFILYVGSEECSACEIFKHNLIDVLYKNEGTAYYLDLNKKKEKEYKKFNKK